MNVVLTRSATRQLDDILDYLDERNPGGADHVARRIRNIFILLETNPHAGAETDKPNVRRMVVTPFPYVVFYRIRRDDIVIQRIRHTSRRPI